ncbi:MAG: hypothetical protein GQ570_02535 [Helicobacteraceae bacterium]|nr:hypothetical protein [Helicobacteraceae bacterium]
MKLANTVALINAKLLTSPSINSFEKIVFDASKVKRGDLFIAFSTEHIEQAVNSGAYGIVFDTPTQVLDNEIAWLEVESVENALLKLLRFTLIEKNVKAYECDEVTLKLASSIKTSNELIVLDSSLKDSANKLYVIEEGSEVLFNEDTTPADLFVDFEYISKATPLKIETIEQTLFEVSFIFDNKFYERRTLSPFFMPYLENLLNFYRSKNIDFKIKQFINVQHFKPLFVTNSLEVKEFGLTQKVLIFEPSAKLFKTQIEFMKNRATWANIIYIIPHLHTLNFENSDNIFTYEDEEDIIELLKTMEYNFALIVGVDESILTTQATIKQQLSLDF